jgi:hypothetical protein
MSYYLLDCDKNLDDFTISNLIIDAKIEINKNILSVKYPLYYNNITAKEIYIKLPKLRLLYDWANLKYNQLKIRIMPKYDKTDAFIKLIKNIETHVQKYFNKKNLEFCSIIIKEKNIKYIKTYYQEDQTKINFENNLKNKITKLTEFKKNGEIQMVIKLSNIWQKENKYGISSHLYQIKYYAPPEEHDIDFFEEPNYIPNYIRNYLPEQINNNNNNINNNNNNNNNNNIAPLPLSRPVMMINSELLKSIKLKPTGQKME